MSFKRASLIQKGSSPSVARRVTKRSNKRLSRSSEGAVEALATMASPTTTKKRITAEALSELGGAESGTNILPLRKRGVSGNVVQQPADTKKVKAKVKISISIVAPPSEPAASAIPSVPAASAIPSVPAASAIPSVPAAIPSVPSVPSVPAASAIPSVPAAVPAAQIPRSVFGGIFRPTLIPGHVTFGTKINDEPVGQVTFHNGTTAIITWFDNGKLSNTCIALGDGRRYHGEYDTTTGRYHGSGVLHHKNGAVAKGTYVNGKMVHAKLITFPNGDTYTGGMKDGERYGKGTLVESDGTKYDGEFTFDAEYITFTGTVTKTDGTQQKGLIIKKPLQK